MKLFEKTYDGESLCDLSRDMDEVWDKRFNPEVAKVPQDEYGFHKGEFKVTIEWIEEP